MRGACIGGFGFGLVLFFSPLPSPLFFFPADIILSKTVEKMNSLPILKFGDGPDQLAGFQGGMCVGGRHNRSRDLGFLRVPL